METRENLPKSIIPLAFQLKSPPMTYPGGPGKNPKCSTLRSYFHLNHSSQLKIILIITWEAMGDFVGLVMLSMSFHVVVHEAFVSGQLSSDLFPSSKPVGEPTESLGSFIRAFGLLPHLVPVLRYEVLVVIRPGLVEIPVDLETLSVADVELPAPTSKGFPSSIRAEGLSIIGLLTLNFKPPNSQVYDRINVVLRIATIFPLRVASEVPGIHH